MGTLLASPLPEDFGGEPVDAVEVNEGNGQVYKPVNATRS